MHINSISRFVFESHLYSSSTKAAKVLTAKVSSVALNVIKNHPIFVLSSLTVMGIGVCLILIPFKIAPLNLEMGIEDLFKKTKLERSDVKKREMIRDFLTCHWQSLHLPLICNNSENRNYLLAKLNRILTVNIQQPVEIRKRIFQKVCLNFSSFLNDAIHNIKRDIATDKAFQSIFYVDATAFVSDVRVLGDETHNEGKNPLMIVVNLNNRQRIVYKPRSIVTEQIICGQSNSLFQRLNLPCYRVYDRKQYGYCEFLENLEEENTIHSQEELITYLGHFVLMDQLANQLGMSDLHQENVVTVNKRPYLIDTEVIAPMVPDTFFSGLITGLTAGYLFSEETTNRIWFAKDLLSESTHQLLLGTFDSQDAYIALQEVIPNLSERLGQHIVLPPHQIEFIAQTKAALSDHSHRIVLIGTLDLALFITLPIDKGFKDFECKLREGLLAWGFIPNYSENFLKIAFEWDVMNNDVPVFSYIPKKRCVYYNKMAITKLAST
jgi:hypothetical protein